MEKRRIIILTICISGLLAIICFLLARIGALFSILAVSFMAIAFGGLTYYSWGKHKEYGKRLEEEKNIIMNENEKANLKKLNKVEDYELFRTSLTYLVFGFCTIACVILLFSAIF